MYVFRYAGGLYFASSKGTPYTRKEYKVAGTYSLTIPDDITELIVTGCGGGAGGLTLGMYNSSEATSLKAGNGGDSKVGSFVIPGGKGGSATLASGNVMSYTQPNASTNGIKGEAKQVRNQDFTLHGYGFMFSDSRIVQQADIMNNIGYYSRKSNAVNDCNYTTMGVGTVEGYGVYGAGGGTFHYYDSDGTSNQVGIAGNSGGFVTKQKVPVTGGSTISIVVGAGGKYAFRSNDGDGARRFRVTYGTPGFLIIEYGDSTLYNVEYLG